LLHIHLSSHLEDLDEQHYSNKLLGSYRVSERLCECE